MTVEELMNTMKRRGTADLSDIKWELPSTA